MRSLHARHVLRWPQFRKVFLGALQHTMQAGASAAISLRAASMRRSFTASLQSGGGCASASVRWGEGGDEGCAKPGDQPQSAGPACMVQPPPRPAHLILGTAASTSCMMASRDASSISLQHGMAGLAVTSLQAELA